MRGVVFPGDGRAEVRDFPEPQPGPGQVVVRMKASGLCGSDLHMYRRTAAERAGDDTIPGHEPSGIVHELGHGAGGVKVGDRVSVYHYLGCGRCRHCNAGDIMHCADRRGYGGAIHGSHGDFILTDARNCLPLPEGLSFADGAIMACGAGTAFSSMRKLRVSGEDTIVVFGQGPVGLNGLLIAKALGGRVIGVEPVAERRALSAQLGADEVINPSGTDVIAAVRDLTDGRGADMAFETSGSSAGRRTAVECLRLRGRAVFVGLGPSNVDGDPFDSFAGRIVTQELTLMGSYVMPIRMYPDMVNLIVRHGIALDKMVTHRFSINDAPEAFRLFDTGRTGKVIFEWD